MTGDLIGTVSTCGHAELAARLTAAGQSVDALIVDAPYSARTHSGYDDGIADADTYRGRDSKRTPAGGRRSLAYSSWGLEEVNAFMATWAPLCSGWFVTITDHVLAPAWESALSDAGLYVFAPLACVDSGSRIRLVGDGPANWSVWTIVARPKTRQFQRWATIDARAERGAESLPGAYVVPAGAREPKRMRLETQVVGGKPIWLMRALVRDYSRPGDIVCDPCAGAGTTLLAAKLEGRRYVGGDIDPAHAELARERLRNLPSADRSGTLALFGGER